MDLEAIQLIDQVEKYSWPSSTPDLLIGPWRYGDRERHGGRADRSGTGRLMFGMLHTTPLMQRNGIQLGL